MRLFLVAGEPSGDRLGAALMAGISSFRPGTEFGGVGGPAMHEEGLESLFPMEELSVFGLAEVLPKYFRLKRRLKETVEAAIEFSPDALVTIDSPDFCLRVAKEVRRRAPEIRIAHYVAPSVWAWRPGRAAKMAAHVDQVLALLPFEPPYFEAVGLRCDFVGHPAASEPQATKEEISAFRTATGIGDAPVLLALPGSRASEIARLAPVFGEALRSVLARRPEIRVVVPAVEAMAGTVREAVASWPGRPLAIAPNESEAIGAVNLKLAAFGAAELALAASGTVSLELAASATPMAIAYDMNWITWSIVSRLARVDTVTLVNLASETRAVPEFLGPGCRSGPIADALLELIDDGAARRAQLDAMAETMRRLGRGGEPPGRRAARAVLDGLGERIRPDA